MFKLTERMPPMGEGLRVLIFTEGSDFAGEQFFDVKADSLNEAYFDDPDDMPEVCRYATHWMPLPYPGTATADHLAQALNEGDGVYRP